MSFKNKTCPVCGNSDRKLIELISQVDTVCRIYCRICGLTFFDRPIKKKPSYNWAYNAEFYRAGDIRKAGIMAAWVAETMKKETEKKSILEIGPGNGLTAFMLKQMEFNIEGIDICRETCIKLENKYQIKMNHSEFESWNTTKKFDAIYAAHVIEHSENPIIFITKCYYLLNDKGILFIDTPDGNKGIKKGKDWHHYKTRNIFEHSAILTAGTLKMVAEKSGFETIEIIYSDHYDSFQAILRRKENEQNIER